VHASEEEYILRGCWCMYSHDVGMLFLNKTILRVEKYPTGESRVTTVKYPIGESHVALYETGKCNEKQQ